MHVPLSSKAVRDTAYALSRTTIDEGAAFVGRLAAGDCKGGEDAGGFAGKGVVKRGMPGIIAFGAFGNLLFLDV